MTLRRNIKALRRQIRVTTNITEIRRKKNRYDDGSSTWLSKVVDTSNMFGGEILGIINIQREKMGRRQVIIVSKMSARRYYIDSALTSCWFPVLEKTPLD